METPFFAIDVGGEGDTEYYLCVESLVFVPDIQQQFEFFCLLVHLLTIITTTFLPDTATSDEGTGASCVSDAV